MILEALKLVINFWLRLSALIVCSTLLGCNEKPCVDGLIGSPAAYNNCLLKYESIERTRQFGAFTVLTIRYTEPSGDWGADFQFERVLFKGRILKKNVDYVRQWIGLSETVLFLEFYDGDAGTLHLTYERGGRAIVESIDAGRYGWVATYEYPNGFPLSDNVRYFPRYVGANDAGFLLRALPTRITALPSGPEGVRAPWIRVLAAVAPDGKAYAYTDSTKTPSVVVVVDDNGFVHDPIPIPFTFPALGIRSGENMFEPVWQWFNDSYVWEKNAQGGWEVARKSNYKAAHSTNPVEEVFIDAMNGYKTCFASHSPGCLSGWRNETSTITQLDYCCLSPHIYTPSKPLRVFGGNLVRLVYSRSTASGSGYQVQLDASSASVITALEDRLKTRKVPFVRVDDCPDLASKERECIARLKRNVNWKDSTDRDFIGSIFSAAGNGAVFVTPTVALAIYSAPNDQTWIDTLARYDHSASPASGND